MDFGGGNTGTLYLTGWQGNDCGGVSSVQVVWDGGGGTLFFTRDAIAAQLEASWQRVGSLSLETRILYILHGEVGLFSPHSSKGNGHAPDIKDWTPTGEVSHNIVASATLRWPFSVSILDFEAFVAPLGNVSRQDGKVCMRRMPGGVAERQLKPLKGVDPEMHSRSVRVEVGDVDELQHDYLSPESVMP